MKKLIKMFLVVFFCFSLAVRPAQAEEIEVQRGEEKETEIVLEGTEDVYSVLGELECTKDYVLLKQTDGENTGFYQAVELAEDGSGGKLLLSARRGGGYNLRLRLKVEGIRIGTGVVRIANARLTGEDGEWLEAVNIGEITVNVLPNPLVVSLSGKQGKAGWYTSAVDVTVTDMDAAKIWYDDGSDRVEYTGEFTLYNGKHVLTVTSDDGFGYQKEEICYVSVDTINPSITVSAQESGWQQEDIEVTARAADRLSGISYAGWFFSENREESGPWNTLGEEQVLRMEQDGIWYLHLCATDEAGNESSAVYGPYRKDSIKPEISFGNLYQDQLVEKSILPEITVSDELSGIKETVYLLDGKPWSLSEIREKGTHILTVTVEDFSGNSRTETVEFSIYDPVSITARTGDTHYTGTASCSALVMYSEEPLADRDVEFFVNGESIGVQKTDRNGQAWLHFPVELEPQEAELTVRVEQDDENFLLAAEDSCYFTVKPEKAWLLYTGDYSVRNGEPLRIRLETGELPDYRMGDITRAELLAELYLIENDGSRTFVEEELLFPDMWGTAFCELYPGTGLYELKVSFAEGSCYTGQELVLHPAVYDMDASLDWEGGSLLLDLPHLGLYVNVVFTFLPPSVEAQIDVRIPGTGITLTENRLTGYDLTMDGIVLYGTAVNPKDNSTYCYEIRSAYTLGIFLNELEVSLWKGEDKSKEPVYYFQWNAWDGTTAVRSGVLDIDIDLEVPGEQ